MRALLTLIAALVLSWFVSYVAAIGLGIAFNAQEELIVAMVAQIVFGMVVIAIFGVILLAGGGVRTLGVAAAVSGIVLVLALAVFEALTLAGEPAPRLDRDMAMLTEIVLPALLGLAVQWSLLRRYLVRRDAGHPPLAAQPVTG